MPATHQRDYFAELYVAGLMGDCGWSVYFPKRDVGFDFIATRNVHGVVLVRPIHVKGLYPTEAKKDKSGYGFVGRLTQLHDDMILALPFFSTDRVGPAPVCIAYMPRSAIRVQRRKGYKCMPARFASGRPEPRATFRKYFDIEGLKASAHVGWGKSDA
jgi:hypothetical protein